MFIYPHIFYLFYKGSTKCLVCLTYNVRTQPIGPRFLGKVVIWQLVPTVQTIPPLTQNLQCDKGKRVKVAKSGMLTRHPSIQQSVHLFLNVPLPQTLKIPPSCSPDRNQSSRKIAKMALKSRISKASSWNEPLWHWYHFSLCSAMSL